MFRFVIRTATCRNRPRCSPPTSLTTSYATAIPNLPPNRPCPCFTRRPAPLLLIPHGRTFVSGFPSQNTDTTSSTSHKQNGFAASSLWSRSILPSLSSGSPYGLVGGAVAAAILVLIAASVPAAGDNGANFDVSVPLQTVSEFLEAVADYWKWIASVDNGLWSSISIYYAKAMDAASSMSILARSVKAVLFSAGEEYANELALRWRLRVISLIADLAGSSHSRRSALVKAGDGVVADWLLEAVGRGDLEFSLVQAEAARAVSYFLSDAVTCEKLLSRPHAISHLLHFTASIQPSTSLKTPKQKKMEFLLENDDRARGRSMLITSIMDIVTSSCELGDKSGSQPMLSADANEDDILAALKVLQEGGLYLDENQDGGAGKENEICGCSPVGMTVPDETSIVSTQNQLSVSPNGFFGALYSNVRAKLWSYDDHNYLTARNANHSNTIEATRKNDNHGLWDDLHGRYVAVPLAAWAIATWAQASTTNCKKIEELNKDGDAVLGSIMAPERTVKWHGAITAGLVLENGSTDSAVSWSNALLRTANEASEADDIQLALVTLKSFKSCVTKSENAREVVAQHNLPLLREISKKTAKSTSLQKLIIQVVESVCFDGTCLSNEEGKRWSSTLLNWIFNYHFDDSTQLSAPKILAHVLDQLGPEGVPLSQAWLAMIIFDAINNGTETNGDKGSKTKAIVQNHMKQMAVQAANDLTKGVWQTVGDASESEWGDLTKLIIFHSLSKASKKEKVKLSAMDSANLSLKAIKALTELVAEDDGPQFRIVETGGLHLVRRLMLDDDYEQLSELGSLSKRVETTDAKTSNEQQKDSKAGNVSELPTPATHLRKHAARLLSMLSLQPSASTFLKQDKDWCMWLEDCADSRNCSDLKICSYARTTLLNMINAGIMLSRKCQKAEKVELLFPRYEDRIFLFNTQSPFWRSVAKEGGPVETHGDPIEKTVNAPSHSDDFEVDVVFVHGLRGGPFKTWRITDDKTSAVGKAGLVERIDVDSGKEGTCWPKQWLADDIPTCRLLTVKYKTNLSEWSGATLPLQEVSAMLLEKLLAAGVGERPVVFITHSMGGLVVKQMLMQAAENKAQSHLIKNTLGIVFYSCPHFGSKLADMPWRFGLVLRPAPSTSELRSGSARLEELNKFIRTLHKGGLEILSFSETKVTPLVEGYGGWALRMEVVPIESAYPGFGELVVLDGTDHVNSCKPLNRDDAAYTQTLQFVQKIIRSTKSSVQQE